MKSDKIYIRADANEVIATGHIMRCLSIADACSEMGVDVCFITSDAIGKELVDSKGYECIVLKSKWNDLESEQELMVSLIRQHNIKYLLIDSYYVTQRYLLTLKNHTKIIYIDDFGIETYPCDVLINYSSYAFDIDYKAKYDDTKLLLGWLYAPLRKEFRELPIREHNNKVQDILVLTGGADIYHFASELVNYIKNNIKDCIQDVSWHIVCGRLNGDFEELKKYESEHIKIYKSVSNLYELMIKADIAISAGGSTLYELCACGTPTITYSVADNQLKNVYKFHEMNYMPFSGCLDKGYDYNRLIDIIIRMIDDYDLYVANMRQLQKSIDGRGALRVVEEIIRE